MRTNIKSSRAIAFGVLCLAAALAGACGTDDDSTSLGDGGSSGAGKTAGSGGRTGTAGISGVSGGMNTNGGNGGNIEPGGGGMGAGVAGMNPGEGGEGGEGGEAGAGGMPGTGCTQFAPFVRGLIASSTTNQAVPTPVNDIMFCDDPQSPAAFQDLF